MRNALFYGSGVALVTPFRAGKVDMHAFERLIDWQIESLTDAIIVLGTTGEPCTVTSSGQCSADRVRSFHGGRARAAVGGRGRE